MFRNKFAVVICLCLGIHLGAAQAAADTSIKLGSPQTGTATNTDVDGTPDCKDLCPNNPLAIDPGVCGCDMPDQDTDGEYPADYGTVL